MRRYFVRLADGTAKRVENKNDALECIERGRASAWWTGGCTCGAPGDAEPEDHDLDCPEHPTGEEEG